MSPQKATLSIVIVSIVFAAAMIISSIFLADKAYLQTVILLLIALWFVPFAYLTKVKKENQK
ncbi:MAG: hypothetical protein IPF56_09770 [Chloroflexi bacterium]|jgi:hypothetical protein|nr:hypothetical protein [Chloroflexota bacterium]MBK6709523.1 hypothetical protein [Chloroflexota bacterium]MBK7180323.1 hypothetical protein [Chloroflexota bacterium]MBK7915286.1 hypothetical protein [Chloroflexota bacterium]MBK8934230.1 hypothetical protein [Chloroflexota bacterium]